MESKAKATVTFHSGILTIGGTVIEVAYKDAHIFFDFGTEYQPELLLADEALQTLIDHRLVPELKNIYDPRLAYDYHGTEEKEYLETAVFLSHAHLDHSKMINYLDPKIPLYTLKETKEILQELNRTGDFLLASPYEAPNFVREMIGLAPHEIIHVGEISVEIVPVDHDAYGAAALLIRTPEKLIAYTGDLRLHGYQPELTKAFCRQAEKTDLLLMEGVSISFPERQEASVETNLLKVNTEPELIEKLIALVDANPHRQITFNGYPANVERFLQICQAAPRQVVLEANQAALLQKVFGKKVAYYYATTETIPELDPNLEVSYQTLLEDTTTYLWQVVGHFEQLKPEGLYIHSDAQPLGSFDPAYDKFLLLLEDLKIEFIRLALSGHAFPDDLDQIIAWIKPQLLVPIHTLKPEKLVNPYGERILPQRGAKIEL